MIMRLLALTLALLMTSGCMDDQLSSQQHQQPPENQHPRAADGPDWDSESLEAAGRDQQWSDCTYMWLKFTWPGPTNPRGPPANWTQPTFALQTNTYYAYYECERFSWMDFERPIKILWELNGNLVADNNCTTGDNFPASLVEAVYLDDAEIADAWKDQYELPTQIATMSLTTQLSSKPMEARLEWRVADYPPSVGTYRFGGDLVRDAPHSAYIVWERGDGINVLEQAHQTSSYSPATPTATADVNAPMMVDGTIADAPVVRAGFNPQTTVTATLTEYKDKLCEEPY